MKRFALAALFLLAACTSPEQRAEREAQINAADIQECVELGFEPNTPEFADCRLRLREMRQRERAIRQNNVGVGVGWGFGRRRVPASWHFINSRQNF